MNKIKCTKDMASLTESVPLFTKGRTYPMERTPGGYKLIDDDGHVQYISHGILVEYFVVVYTEPPEPPLEGATLKQQFRKRILEVNDPQILVIAEKGPNDAIDIKVIQKENIEMRTAYYETLFDQDFRSKSNPEAQVVGFMLV